MRALKIAAFFAFNALLSALLFEVGARLLANQLPGLMGQAARWATYGTPYAESWTPAWVQNRDHYWALRPGLQDALQYGSPSVAFRLSTVELWPGGGIGFRTRPIDFFVDGVVVGDSFGLCFTEQMDCWVDVLGQRLGLRLVNLSQPVTGSQSHARILRDFAEPLRAPLVIWQFFGNDFNDDYGLAVFRKDMLPIDDEAASAAEEAGLRAWLRRHSAAWAVIETILAGRVVNAPAGEALFVKPYSVRYGPNREHVLHFGGQYELQALDMSRPQNQAGLKLSRAAFEEARNRVEAWGGQMVVVLIPTREEVYAPLTAPILGQQAIDQLASARLAMLSLCEALALRCYDALPDLRQAADEGVALYYSDDMHLNPLGNRVLAENLALWLEGLDLRALAALP
ncbi:MAG: hypothetical protein NZ750_04495 [Anaerolineae bacterium]|nr:hypothetical protein [Anaerolineae bacterium]MDW8171228.1 hypothetical protein [Anaerolineae bacterium]